MWLLSHSWDCYHVTNLKISFYGRECWEEGVASLLHTQVNTLSLPLTQMNNNATSHSPQNKKKRLCNQTCRSGLLVQLLACVSCDLTHAVLGSIRVKWSLNELSFSLTQTSKCNSMLQSCSIWLLRTAAFHVRWLARWAGSSLPVLSITSCCSRDNLLRCKSAARLSGLCCCSALKESLYAALSWEIRRLSSTVSEAGSTTVWLQKPVLKPKWWGDGIRKESERCGRRPRGAPSAVSESRLSTSSLLHFLPRLRPMSLYGSRRQPIRAQQAAHSNQRVKGVNCKHKRQKKPNKLQNEPNRCRPRLPHCSFGKRKDIFLSWQEGVGRGLVWHTSINILHFCVAFIKMKTANGSNDGETINKKMKNAMLVGKVTQGNRHNREEQSGGAWSPSLDWNWWGEKQSGEEGSQSDPPKSKWANETAGKRHWEKRRQMEDWWSSGGSPPHWGAILCP